MHSTPSAPGRSAAWRRLEALQTSLSTFNPPQSRSKAQLDSSEGLHTAQLLLGTTNPFPLLLNPPNPLITNPPLFYILVLYWRDLVLGGWGGLVLGEGITSYHDVLDHVVEGRNVSTQQPDLSLSMLSG